MIVATSSLAPKLVPIVVLDGVTEAGRAAVGGCRLAEGYLYIPREFTIVAPVGPREAKTAGTISIMISCVDCMDVINIVRLLGAAYAQDEGR